MQLGAAGNCGEKQDAAYSNMVSLAKGWCAERKMHGLKYNSVVQGQKKRWRRSQNAGVRKDKAVVSWKTIGGLSNFLTLIKQSKLCQILEKCYIRTWV